MHDEASSKARIMRGLLWGTAVGDALGLPYEGLSRRELEQRGAALDRYHLLGQRGFVSDDTEQSALVVESLLEARGDLARARRRFRRALGAWLLRLPFGVGLATLGAGLRILLGRAESGARSAGNGAAMRAAPIGVFHADDEALRRATAAELARVTHTDRRAVEGAVYTAELASLCASGKELDRGTLALRALSVVTHTELREAIEGAVLLASTRHVPEPGPRPGYVVSTLAVCTWAFVHAGTSVLDGVRAAIRVGGDTDSTAAIVGAWLGALHGPEDIPARYVGQLDDGPFGPSHLAALADATGRGSAAPSWSRLFALARNLFLFPVVLGHGLLRLARLPVRPQAPARGTPRVHGAARKNCLDHGRVVGHR